MENGGYWVGVGSSARCVPIYNPTGSISFFTLHSRAKVFYLLVYLYNRTGSESLATALGCRVATGSFSALHVPSNVRIQDGSLSLDFKHEQVNTDSILESDCSCAEYNMSSGKQLTN